MLICSCLHEEQNVNSLNYESLYIEWFPVDVRDLSFKLEPRTVLSLKYEIFTKTKSENI